MAEAREYLVGVLAQRWRWQAHLAGLAGKDCRRSRLARSFAELFEQAVRKDQSLAIEIAQRCTNSKSQ